MYSRFLLRVIGFIYNRRFCDLVPNLPVNGILMRKKIPPAEMLKTVNKLLIQK